MTCFRDVSVLNTFCCPPFDGKNFLLVCTILACIVIGNDELKSLFLRRSWPKRELFFSSRFFFSYCFSSSYFHSFVGACFARYWKRYYLDSSGFWLSTLLDKQAMRISHGFCRLVTSEFWCTSLVFGRHSGKRGLLQLRFLLYSSWFFIIILIQIHSCTHGVSWVGQCIYAPHQHQCRYH